MADAPDTSAFESLEQDYKDTLAEIGRHGTPQAMQPFKDEYEKLHKALQKSHEAEQRLLRRCRDLNQAITADAAKVQTAMKLSQDDQQEIARLRREIENQKRLVEASHDKEEKSRQQIAEHKGEIEELQDKIEQGAGQTRIQEQQVQDLKDRKDSLAKEQSILKQNVDMMTGVVSEALSKLQAAEAARAAAEESSLKAKQRLAAKREEVSRSKEQKEVLEQTMKDLRSANEGHHVELTAAQKRVQAVEMELKKIEGQIRDTERDEQKLEDKVKQKMNENKTLDAKWQQETTRNSKYLQENKQRENTVRSKQEEIWRINQDKEKVAQMHNALKKKERILDEEKRTLEDDRNEMRRELKSLQERLDTLGKESDVDRKKIEDLLRERDILNKNVIKADDRTKKQIDLVKRQETQSVNLKKDIERWKHDAQEFKARIVELEKQREKYGIELSQAQSRYFNALEEKKRHDEKLTELKKQIAEVQAKLNQQKMLYESVCTERNLNCKSLMDHNKQIADMKQKFKLMFHHTTSLKEEIREKDNKLIRGLFEHHKVANSNAQIKELKEKAHRRMRNLDNIVKTQQSEIKKLESSIQEAEQERQAQLKELDGVIGERDILGAQLIRRNEELALLYEKIKIQQSTLQKGEIQYRQTVQEIGSLKGQLREAKGKLAGARNQVVNVETLRREVHYLSKELLREEAKAKALQEELENPMNVHRWRQLEGSNPAAFEMILKVKTLQKRLIAKTEEVIEKDGFIQEKEKLYVQLKNILARQPGPEVAEQLSWYSQNLKEKTAHMKQMASELKTYHGQTKDLQDEIERYQKDLQSMKDQYFRSRRQQHRELLMQQQGM